MADSMKMMSDPMEMTEMSNEMMECKERMHDDMMMSSSNGECGQGVPLSIKGSMPSMAKEMMHQKSGGKKMKTEAGPMHNLLGGMGTNGKVPITKKAKNEIA